MAGSSARSDVVLLLLLSRIHAGRVSPGKQDSPKFRRCVDEGPDTQGHLIDDEIRDSIRRMLNYNIQPHRGCRRPRDTLPDEPLGLKDANDGVAVKSPTTARIGGSSGQGGGLDSREAGRHGQPHRLVAGRPAGVENQRARRLGSGARRSGATKEKAASRGRRQNSA